MRKLIVWNVMTLDGFFEGPTPWDLSFHELVWGPELEFYIFDSVSLENKIHAASYRVDSSEANWNNSQPGQGHTIPIHGGYHAIPPRDHLYGLRTEMVRLLQQSGVPVKYHHHEVGGPGQCEIETPMMGMLKSADAAMLIKYI